MEWIDRNQGMEYGAISPLDGRYRKKVESLAPYFSEAGLVRYRLLVEIRWLEALCSDRHIAEARQLGEKDRADLQNLIDQYGPEDYARIKGWEAKINHDVKSVEYYLKDKLRNLRLADLAEMVHFACTSEDINNLSYALLIRDAIRETMLPALKLIQDDLQGMAGRYKNIPMMARTHGQTASPTTLGKEIANVAARLERPLSRLESFQFMGKMNGATGNYNAHVASYPQVDWIGLSGAFIDRLGLAPNYMTTQIEPHDWMAELFGILSGINTILLDLSRDFWLYIMNGIFIQRVVEGEVGSSTMPHKVNPIDFENAEGNLGIANALLGHLAGKLPISRLQRDLSDSTVQRNIGVAFGHSLLAWKSLRRGLSRVEPNERGAAEELASAWEVLAEAVQTLMRKYKIGRPYEHLKELTRGKAVDQAAIRAFIEKLKIPAKEKRRLMNLTPEKYIGLSAKLVDRHLNAAEESQPAAEAQPKKQSVQKSHAKTDGVNGMMKEKGKSQRPEADTRRPKAKKITKGDGVGEKTDQRPDGPKKKKKKSAEKKK